jgi:flagellar basal body-associated protein FliL
MAEDRTIIVETPSRGSGAGLVIAIVLVVALVLGVMFVTRIVGSEATKNNAITSAANNVGDAAKDVGDAVKPAK